MLGRTHPKIFYQSGSQTYTKIHFSNLLTFNCINYLHVSGNFFCCKLRRSYCEFAEVADGELEHTAQKIQVRGELHFAARKTKLTARWIGVHHIVYWELARQFAANSAEFESSCNNLSETISYSSWHFIGIYLLHQSPATNIMHFVQDLKDNRSSYQRGIRKFSFGHWQI